jgi:hypothetical protein
MRIESLQRPSGPLPALFSCLNSRQSQLQPLRFGLFYRVLVQRQLEKVRLAANEWVLVFWLRLAFRVSLA